LLHDGLGQTCNKTHEREAKLDDPVKKCVEVTFMGNRSY